ESRGDGRLLRDRPRERFRVVEPRGSRVDLRGKADRLRLIGLDAAAGKDQLVGAVFPDATGEPLRSARSGDDPEVDLGLSELGRSVRDDDVAGPRELGAT